MICVDTYREWRRAARELLLAGVRPESVVWTSAAEEQQVLFDPAPVCSAAPLETGIPISRAFLDLAEGVSYHSDSRRWSILYRVAWRLTHGEHHLLAVETDDDVIRLHDMRRSVVKDIHRMRAFVRFRRVEAGDGEQFIAWYEPEHNTLEANGRFFVDRFGSMNWAILTPRASLLWDLHNLRAGPGVPRQRAPRQDELEDLWRLYYRTIYNPARLNLTVMRGHLPVSRWKDLPEAQTIPELVRLSRGRVQQMAEVQMPSASSFVPEDAGLAELGRAVRHCGACELCRRATQAVWGEGNSRAAVMLVGEQPGEAEDIAGRPFVGPAGEVLDAALAQAGLARDELYVTNAVKAFRFEERGNRRIHQTPRGSDIGTCRPWLLAEMQAVRPRVIICLGASAAQSVLGRKAQIAAERGRLFPCGSAQAGLTYHPSAILRAPQTGKKQELFATLVSDLVYYAAAAAHESAATPL